MASRRVVTNETIVVDGLSQLSRALREADADVAKELRQSLRTSARVVQEAAKANISHRTGRHDPDVPRLADSLKVGVGATSVSLYSNALHAGVQDQGGKVGRGRLTLLKRSEVSQYMTRATQEKDGAVEDDIRQAVNRGLRALD